jgi:transcription elongation factor GreB
MSKAFTKESETDDEDELPPDDPAPLPPGTKNYMTPAGFKRLRDEREFLVKTERPKIVDIVSWAAGNGDRSENGDYLYGKKRLREIDRRLRFLTKRLEVAEVVDPTRQQGLKQIFFGATVTYANERDEELTVTLVGIDEADMERGQISWISPVARALMKAKVGDTVEVKTPIGPETLEVLEIEYRLPDAAS